MIGTWLRAIRQTEFTRSYAQCGEDVIMRFIFDALRIARPAYLDIGASHPTRLSNTYLFYRQGCRGVCVEPDPTLYRIFRRRRPHDVVLNLGIGDGTTRQADFFMMTSPTLNTFSRETAERYQNEGRQRIERVVSVPLAPVEELLARYFPQPPQLLSLDVEGYDLLILRALNRAGCRPTVICVETLTYSTTLNEQKLDDTITFLGEHGYMLYADTYINSIFVEERAWRARPA